MIENGGNRFTTTIHVLIAAVIKIGRAMKLPSGLKLYRGLGGDRQLSDSFYKSDKQGNKGLAEWGFMSTTASKEIAIQYSGIREQKPFPIIFEIITGVIDSGACIKSFSQYLKEKEYLWVPVSFIEPSGERILEVSPHGVITRIAVRVNMNIKSDTTTEFEERKKSLHISSFEYLIEELERDLNFKLSDNATIERAKRDDHCNELSVEDFAKGIVVLCKKTLEEHRALKCEDFRKAETFRALVVESLEVKEQAEAMFECWMKGN
jgi:hypothetical protein